MELAKIYPSRIWGPVLYGALGLITVLHLVVFIQYYFVSDSFSPETNKITLIGELMKTYLPLCLLATLIPAVHRWFNRVLPTSVVVLAGIVFIALCLINQVVGSPGQAWSTVAFSTILILAMYHYLSTRCTVSRTVLIVLCFMAVFLGWVAFEVIYQVGLWHYHPEVFEFSSNAFRATLRTVITWFIAPLSYIVYVLMSKKIRLRLNLPLVILIVVSAAATYLWFYRGMLVPTYIDSNGDIQGLNIGYFTMEHLDFSISRLVQIGIMGVSALMIKGHH